MTDSFNIAIISPQLLGPVAQLVRAPALQAGGQGFESLQVHQEKFRKFFEPDGTIASRLRRSAGARPARRDAAKSHGLPNETETFIRV